MKCKFCNNEIKSINEQGYLPYLDDMDGSNMKSLGLSVGQNLCIPCKREIMFAGLNNSY